jgi:alkanesulfonate monooxygenase SsuD/methylene tetrahydromethanopterin reductase-like flavin-dependent oxidoreductase (luciferase family)
VEFGTFVWVDAGDRPLHQLYDDHLRLAALADELGFFAYHMAEHHNTPLGLAPSPSVFLAAVARSTTRIRLGPLVYLLPLYRPQRLAEEVCMLDHLSNGRLELGVGRGVSPWELGHNGVDAATSRPLFLEALDDLLAALHGDGSPFGDLGGAPIEIRPLQQPHPPLTYATTVPESVAWAAGHGMHLMGLGPAGMWRSNVELYRERWEAHRADPDRHNGHVERPRIGLNRQVLVAETDAEALDLVRRVYPRFASSFIHLWEAHGDDTFRHRIDLEKSLEHEVILVGSPESVRAMVERTVEQSGIDYLTCSFAWGSLTFEEAARSMELFACDVMPAFAAV